MLHTPYDKATKRYTEIADYFVPRGTPSSSSTCATGTAPRDRDLLPLGDAAHRPDGYDIVEWIAAQLWTNGRIGTVGSSYAGQVQIRTALERPPHLTAICPTW
jgi:dienelactone hydrolase